ncbi:MAG: EamA family transporter [Acidobacteriia bacterium]|nr:EamA family transporter [Terriglobia bacterium]
MNRSGMHGRPKPALLILAFVAIYVVWGSTYLGIRVAIESIPPLLMMGIRHLAAGTLLFAYLRLRGEAAPPRFAWKPAVLAGALCFLGGHGLLAWAEQRVSSGMAALLVSLEPVIMVLLARRAKQEGRISGGTLAGLAFGIAGVAVLMPIDAKGEMIATAALLLGGVLWSVGAIYARGAVSGVSSGMYSAMQMLTGGVLLLAVGTGLGERVQLGRITPRSVLALGYLIVFGSIIAFSAYTWLMRVSTAARVGTHAYVNPIIAVWLGWALGGEVVTARMLIGAAIVLASVLLVNQAESGKAVALGSQQQEAEAEAAAD